VALATAIKALAEEQESLEQTERPAVRLGQLSADLAELDRELAVLKAPYETQLGWIAAGQEGERPQPSLRISTLEARRRLLAADAEAVASIRQHPGEHRIGRPALRLSQARLASLCGIAVVTLREFELGRARLHPNHRQSLAGVLRGGIEFDGNKISVDKEKSQRAGNWRFG